MANNYRSMQYGQPGRYRASGLTLLDGQGAALGLDASGNLLVNVATGGAGGTQYAEGTTTSPATGTVALGRYTTSAPTLTNGQLNAMQLDVNGNTVVVGNVANNGTDAGSPIKIGGVQRTTQPTLTDGQRGDFQMDTKANAKVTLMANGTQSAITAIATNADGFATSATGSHLEVVNRNSLYNGTTYDRQVSAGGAVAAGTGVAATSIVPTTSQLGLTIFSNTAVSNTAVAVKASAGRLNWYNIYNPNAAVTYLQVFNKTTGSVTVGTTAPDISIGIPASGSIDGESIMSLNWSTAITIAATTTPTGSTAAGSGLVVNFGYI